ncbi:Putative Holin-X, holin superfamily III [Jannaschia faecimaris]|uniref:Putative Holin-X, holin superfamily III n=1 Tax=Jannaschia faecimaris TaxID=1244108 RepID=A0A1H3MDX8_9RHOB|nr:phage holin family protein [Jannaschia faecimaris]SDY74389.1 Putative Holin-X, holin superfamily III [Jannaschia faecimaris]
MNDQSPNSGKGPVNLINDILTHVTALIRKEFDLARAEISENINRAAVAIGLLVGALIVALVSLNVLAGALVAGVAKLGVAPGWAALIVGGIMALVAAVMVAKGVRDLKLVSLAPTRMAKNIRRDAEAMKESI